jgi:hypothetical protein
MLMRGPNDLLVDKLIPLDPSSMLIESIVIEVRLAGEYR